MKKITFILIVFFSTFSFLAKDKNSNDSFTIEAGTFTVIDVSSNDGAQIGTIGFAGNSYPTQTGTTSVEGGNVSIVDDNGTLKIQYQTPSGFVGSDSFHYYYWYQGNWYTSFRVDVTVIDTTPPVITGTSMQVSIQGGGSGFNYDYVKAGDIITVVVNSNEPINQPSLTIAGENVSFQMISPQDWLGSLTVTNNTTEGPANFLVSNISDIAGNSANDVSTLTLGNLVTIDTTRPTGYQFANATNPVNLVTSNSFSFEVIGLEANASYEYTITDPLSANPIEIKGSGVYNGTGQLVFTHDVSSLEDGTLIYDFRATDAAGNVGPGIGGATTKDTTKPTAIITRNSQTQNNTSFTNLTTLKFGITFSEDVQNVDVTDLVLDKPSGSSAVISNFEEITSGSVYELTVTSIDVNGAYSINFDSNNNVEDLNGNSFGGANIPFYNVDLIVPVITLIGDNPQIIEVNGNYTELGATAFDNLFGPISNDININSSTVNTSVVGSYFVTYNVSDAYGNETTATRTVSVVDTTIPVITLIGANPQTVQLNTNYTELGATAFDNYDGDITANINIDDSNVDVSTVGRYNVTYNVSDSSGNDAVQVTRVVHVMDTKPTVEDDAITVLKNSTDNRINVLDNDCFGTFGPNTGHSLTLINGKSSIISANGGSITIQNNGTPNNLLDDYISYTPEGDTGGYDDTFTYTITDTNGVAATATVTVTVSNTNAQGYLPDSFTVLQDSSNNELDIMANDTDDATFGPTDTRFLIESIDHLTGSTEYGGVVTLNTKGTPNDTSDDVINYTPKSGFFGTDTFRYVPGNNRNDLVLVTITVTEVVPPANETPTALDDTATVLTTDSGFIIDVLSNDSPGSDGYINDGLRMPNGTFGGASTEGGLISINTNGTSNTSDDVFEYTPPAGFTGTDTFQYTITDASGDAATATVTVTVNAVTNVPTAGDDSFTVVEGSSNNDLNILANDSFGTDGYSTTIPITAITPSANGATVIVVDNALLGDPTDNTIVYTPAANFVGIDTFSYILTDANGDTATATVTVTVTAVPVVNGTPTAVDDTATVVQDSTNNLLNVLINDDYGTDGANATHPITFSNGSTSNASSEGGAVSIVDDNGVNKISYSPAKDFVGTDTISYIITDASGDASTATVTVTVTSNGVVSTPTAVDDSASVAVKGSVEINVLANDSSGSDGYADGGLTMTNGTLISASTKGGAISIDNKGTLATSDDVFNYTAFKGAIAGDTDTFQYTITDASGDASTATVTVTITAAATDVPTAVDDTATATENTAETISVLTNDSFGTDLRATAPNHLTVGGTSTNGGTTVVSGDDIIYTPATDFKGVDTFTYTIEDSTGDTSTATVTVTVSHAVVVNGTPTAVDDVYDGDDGFDRYNWTSSDPIIYLTVLDNDDFGTDGAMTAHNALNLINGKIDEVSAQGRRVRIDDNGTPTDYSDDRIAYYATSNLTVTSDSFTYYITDNSGDATSATVTINYIDVAPPKTGDTTDKDENTVDSSLLVSNEFTAYPNPSQGRLTTAVYSKENTKAILSLYDIRGVEVYRGQLELKPGKNVIENEFRVKSGVMFLKIYNSETNYGIKKIVFK